MNLLSVLFGLIVLFAPLSFVQCLENSFQSSKLPKTMPAETMIRFNEGGGMIRSYRSISIHEDFLDFEELKSGDQNPTKWTVRISNEDKEKLYQVFVKNEFDSIKNDARKGIVYDAGSESISLTVSNEIYSKTYGPNSPMSGDSQKHYRAVSEAINDLVEIYAKKGEKIANNQTILN